MPVPALITDLSTTPSSNSPAGTETPTLGDDYVRTAMAFIAQLRDKLNGTSAAGTLLTPTLSGNTTASYVLTPAVSAASAYRSTGQTLVAGTNTILFDTATANRATSYVAATGIFTAPVTGVYQVNAVIALQNNTVSSATLGGLLISVNNSTAVGASTVYLDLANATVGPSSNAFNRSGSALLSLLSGDTLRVLVLHTGGNLTVVGGSHFSAHFAG